MAGEKSILIADDNPENLKVLSNLLKTEGYQIRIANNGEQAFESFKAEPPDLVMLDIQMPKLDGYEVCRLIKSHEAYKSIPIIFISAMTEAYNKMLAFQAGGDDYIPKPFQVEEVLARVKTHLKIYGYQKWLEGSNIALLEQFKSTFEQAAVGIAHVDPNTLRFFRVNQRLAQILGYTQDELLAQTMSDISHADFVESDKQAIRSLVGGRSTSFVSEKQFVRKDGRAIWGKVTVSRVDNARSDAPDYFVAIVEDITIRKNVEKENKQMELKLKNQLQEITTLNKIATEVSRNLSIEKVVDISFQSISTVISPDLMLLFLKEKDGLVLHESKAKNALMSQVAGGIHYLGKCLCGLAVSAGKPLYSIDIQMDSRCARYDAHKEGIASFAALPLYSRDEIIGVLGLASDTERDFEEQAVFLESMSSQISIGLQNAILYEKSHQYSRQLESTVLELQRSKNSVEDSENRLSLIFNHIHEILALVCVESRERFSIETANAAFLRASIIAGEDVRLDMISGMPLDQFLREIVRADSEKIDAIYERFKQVVIQKKTVNYEESTTVSGGGTIYTEIDLIPVLDRSGVCGKILYLARDITDRKQAETDMKTSHRIFQHSLDFICVAGFDGYFKVLNPAWEKMLGWTMQELKSTPWIEFVHPDDVESAREHATTLLRDNIGNVLENRYMAKDGSYRWLSWKAHVYPEEGVVFAIARDITESKEMAAKQDQYERRIQQAQKMEAIGTLAGGIAHDFNNILSPLIGYTELLKREIPVDSSLQGNLSEVLNAGFRARDLVRQILTFSRHSEQESMPMKMQPVVQEALKLMRASIPTTIDIQQNISPACGVVNADSTKIHQIVMNLATNAYHAMEHSGGTLRVGINQVRYEVDTSLSLDLIPGEYALLEVIDTGRGIERHILDKIFDPYFTTKEKNKGTGLGLSVVQGIVKAYHGDIHVSSQPGKGTHVRVYLPIFKMAGVQNPIDVKQAIPGGTENILLVDDEIAVATMMTKMLERMGYAVTKCTDSNEALGVFRSSPASFDLVITDMTMPNLTGIQLTRVVKSIKADIPVIICTGFSDQIDPKKWRDLGIQGLVSKPLIMREFAEVIRSVLDGS